MLYIKSGEADHVWHVGDQLPPLSGRVVTFQADGHELIYLLAVLRAHLANSHAIGVLGYTPGEAEANL